MPDRTREALDDFLDVFELVFHHDWEFSKDLIVDPLFISENGTFLRPDVEDEGSNWANRGSLLHAYRELVAALGRNQVK